MLKKIMAVIITFTLFFSTFVPTTYGQVKSSVLTKTEAESLSKEKLNIENDYKLQYANLYTRDIQQRQFWNLEFQNDKGNISITMAADTGEIISVKQWNNGIYGNAVVLVEDEAKNIAIDFIKSLEAEKFKETEEVTVNAPTVIPYDMKINYTDNDNYYFMFIRKINGEFFPNNYFRVTVSGVNGSIISYEMKWDIASYKGNNQTINEQKVSNLFKKEDRLQLKYTKLNKYNDGDNKKPILTPIYVYTPKESDKIDAITGRLLSFDELYNWNYYGYPTYDKEGVIEHEMKDEATSNETTEMIPEEGVISKEKAEQIVINAIKDYVDIDGIKINSSRYTTYYGGLKGKFWYIYWYSNEESKYLNSVVDAETGQIIKVSYNKNQKYEPIEARTNSENTISTKEEHTIKEDDAIKLINEKIETMFPKTKGQLNFKLQTSDGLEKGQIYGSSPRFINNIPFENNYVNINYNIESKEINNLNYTWYDVELQNKGSMLDKEKASEIFYNSVGFEKYLVQLKDLDTYEEKGLELPKKELLPVYGLKNFNFAFIDAVTGKPLTYLGEEFDEKQNNRNQFTDIKESPYKKDILLMDKMGILNVTGETFKPEEDLLRKDALKWIVEIGWSNKAYNVDRYYSQSSENEGEYYFKDVSKDSPYYKYIKAAVEFGILENEDYFNPEEKITKIDLTKWIINAMKQKELATYSNIFKVPYKDAEAIRAEDIGYAALSKYYNLFGDRNIEGEFHPNKNLTRSEFIHNMYQLINEYNEI